MTRFGCVVAVGVFAVLAGCGGDKNTSKTNDDGSNQQPNDGGTTPGDGAVASDGAVTSGVSCTTGTLFAGDPVYSGDPSERPASGTGVLADPPLQWQTMVFSGTHLYTRQESEIWSVDLSAASPIETKIASSTPSGSTYPYSANNVSCSAASFTQVRGLAALSDGSLVLSDLFAASIIKITHPDDPTTCMVTVLAGTATVTQPIDPSDSTTFPTYGNTDGTGSAASFNALGALVADSQDNVYVVDNTSADGQGTAILREVTQGGVVTTVLTMPNDDPPTGPETLENFAILNGTIYAAARNVINEGYVISIDPTAKTFATIAGGGGDQWSPVDSSDDPETSGIATDGKGFFVAGSGYVWYVTLGGSIDVVAGTGVDPDFFPSGYDPKMSHPALMLALPTALGSADENGTSAIAQLAYKSGAVYYRGFADGTSDFIEKITCQ